VNILQNICYWALSCLLHMETQQRCRTWRTWDKTYPRHCKKTWWLPRFYP